jgi:23S rRNA (cytosine1962-C5)-methyltransferase
MSLNYQLIDAGNFKKLEKFGPYLISRPSVQAVWRPSLPQSEWRKADALFTRNSGGDGKWTIFNKKIPESWVIDVDQVKMAIKLTDFGHTGIFPEHHSLPILARNIEKKVSQGKEFRLLNLFAYTGAVSLVGANAGANVTHIDASKTSVSWARENAELSGLSDKPVRWIVEDVQKFVKRELKRGNKYHGVVLDPPSFGRGPKGDVWKIEDHLFGLLDDIKEILDEDYSFIQLSAHSQGYTPVALENILSEIVDIKSGNMSSFEMCIKPETSDKKLPAGACALFER